MMRLAWSVLVLIAALTAGAPARARSCDDAGTHCFRCRLADLHPTQIAVGMQEIAVKTRQLGKLTPAQLAAQNRKKPEWVVKGPGGQLYVTDGHHEAVALLQIGAAETTCLEVADLSGLQPDAFWREMRQRKWVYLGDETGRQQPDPSALPRRFADLRDDPYRSLAGAVEHFGGYCKSKQEFAEFAWADYLRTRVDPAAVRADLDGAAKAAIPIAADPAASALPGYKGADGTCRK